MRWVCCPTHSGVGETRPIKGVEHFAQKRARRRRAGIIMTPRRASPEHYQPPCPIRRLSLRLGLPSVLVQFNYDSHFDIPQLPRLTARQSCSVSQRLPLSGCVSRAVRRSNFCRPIMLKGDEYVAVDTARRHNFGFAQFLTGDANGASAHLHMRYGYTLVRLYMGA